jgi:hypothetical protein
MARIVDLHLAVGADVQTAVEDFLCRGLGLPAADAAAGEFAVQVGASRVSFAGARGAPFYHLALLVPGDRFAAARDWLADAAPLLPEAATGETTFDFSFWNALACYCEDPAGTILELIAHRGIGEQGRTGPFSAGELLGVSEIGLVGTDTRAMAEALARDAGIAVWDGTVDAPGRLAFAGEQAHTLILAPAGRGWLPTGRPAEMHAVDAAIEGDEPAVAALPGTPHRVRRVPRRGG